MGRFWSPLVTDLQPYVPGEQTQDKDVIKLNTNENPYGPSPAVLRAIKQYVSDDLRLYPDPEAVSFRARLAIYYNLTKDYFFVGNGSDEVLAFVFRGLFQPDLPIVFPTLTYSFYQAFAKLFELKYHSIPLNANYEINASDYFGNSKIDSFGGIIFANPNAPTGMVLPVSEIKKILYYNLNCTVVVDEAYVGFGAESCISLVKEHPNLLVVRSLSKSRSLAGMRVGYAVGQPHLTEGLNRVKNSFNSYPLDQLALVAAEASFMDDAYFNSTRRRVMSSRQRLSIALGNSGFNVLPSSTNFLLVSHPNHSQEPYFAEPLEYKLRQNNILVRYFGVKSELRSFLRITIGTEEQNRILVQTLRQILDKS